MVASKVQISKHSPMVGDEHLWCTSHTKFMGKFGALWLWKVCHFRGAGDRNLVKSKG